jgi:Thioredoxin like C-terminal domain
MYQLILRQRPIDDRTFEIEFLDRGGQAFAFTFG